MPTPSTPSSPPRSLTPLILIVVITLAPVVFALLAYFVPGLGLTPTTTNNYGHLVQPQRPIPPASTLPLKTIEGTDFDLQSLHGKWILISAHEAACPEDCVQKLFTLRNSHASQGKDVTRLSRIWFVLDDNPIDSTLLEAYKGTHFLRVDTKILAQFLSLDTISPPPQDLNSLSEQDIKTLLEQPMWIIDPLGNLMMEFPANADPIQVRNDIRKLLRNSRIG